MADEVNAYVEIVVPLGMTEDASADDKMIALGSVVDRVLDALPDDLSEHVAGTHTSRNGPLADRIAEQRTQIKILQDLVAGLREQPDQAEMQRLRNANGGLRSAVQQSKYRGKKAEEAAIRLHTVAVPFFAKADDFGKVTWEDIQALGIALHETNDFCRCNDSLAGEGIASESRAPQGPKDIRGAKEFHFGAGLSYGPPIGQAGTNAFKGCWIDEDKPYFPPLDADEFERALAASPWWKRAAFRLLPHRVARRMRWTA